MKSLCLIAVLMGSLIMAYSICKYNKTLYYMKSQAYDKKVFQNWVYRAAFIMMTFFLVGYGLFIGFMSFGEFSSDYILVSLIFFFGAIFVLIMIRVQQIMALTINQKTTETLQSMIDFMEAKDFYTKGHSEHVRNLVELIYKYLPDDKKDSINLNKLRDAAILHDVGKIGIPDEVLNKPAKLTDGEMEIIKTHPLNGKIILEKTCYNEICDWIQYHHERIDGHGYYGLKNEDIPIESKIIALADTFSALYTDRIYRKKFPFEKAIEIIIEASGTQLDSELVEIFCSIDKEEIDMQSPIFFCDSELDMGA